jgi:hypothetical protein
MLEDGSFIEKFSSSSSSSSSYSDINNFISLSQPPPTNNSQPLSTLKRILQRPADTPSLFKIKRAVVKNFDDINIKKRSSGDNNLYRQKKPNCAEKILNEERTLSIIDIFATYIAQIINGTTEEYTEVNILSVVFRMKNIENETFYHAVYKKLIRIPYKSIGELKAGKKALKQAQKERENNMKQYLSQNAEKIDSTVSVLGSKKNTLSYDDSNSSEMEIEEGEEFEFNKLQYSKFLPPIVSNK